MRIPSGVTDQYIYFVAVDATDLKTRETGLSSFTVYRSRNGGVAAAFTTPTINETDTTNMPGVYELLLDEDMTIDAGDDSQEVCLHITHAGMNPVTRVYELYRPKITAGETVTAANGAADADIERLQGSVIATPTAAGVLEVDVTHFGGAAGTFASGRPEVNTSHAAGTAWNSGAISASTLAADTITAAKVANGTIDAATFAAGAIDAAAIATGAIDADAVAADAATEIANAVWDTDATGRQTQGTFGQAIGDPAADTNTIYKAVVTDATGATVGVDVVDLKTQIGVAGAGLTAIDLPDQTMNITGNITGNLSGSVGSVTAGVTVAVGGIAATSFAAGAVDAAAIAADAITNSELAQSAAQEIADEVLNRNLAGGGSGNTRNVRNTLRAIRNKVSEAGGTLTVTEEDDVTPAWTAAVTRTAATDTLTAIDPA